MSKRYEGYISLFEDRSWRTGAVYSGNPLWIDSESFDTGKEIINNKNLTRAGRVNNGSSMVSGVTKPSAQFTYQPRNGDITPVLFSHFQMGTQLSDETNPGTYVFVPSRHPPTYSGNAIYAHTFGDYDTVAGDIFSVSFVKKYFNTSLIGGTNSIEFNHGICDKLTMNLAVGEDLTFDCEYKFRDVVETAIAPYNPPDSIMGTYDPAPPFQWFHGTVLIDGVQLDLERISITGNNNLVERIEVWRDGPENFAFRDYEVTGQFTYDFPKDGMDQIGSMFALRPFAISGTITQGSAVIVVNMPRCVRQPFNVSMTNERVSATIPFLALESGGVSPITVTVITNIPSEFVADYLFDALSGARTFSEFDVYDAADGARTISEYAFYDRDL